MVFYYKNNVIFNGKTWTENSEKCVQEIIKNYIKILFQWKHHLNFHNLA